MTKIVYFLPMTQSHRLFILAYEGCQLLDVTGPAAVFGAANDAAGRRVYDLQIVSPDGGAVATNSGVALHSRRIGGQPDTLLIAGGSLGFKALIARTDARRPALGAAGGASHRPLRLGLHRRLRTRGLGPARRQACGDTLVELRTTGRALPGAQR
jgi:hypothetical protein